MVSGPQKIPVAFYRTPSGVEVVRNWLKWQTPEDRSVIGQDLMRLQFRWPVGMPLSRSLGRGNWELRSDLSENRTARVLFAFLGGRLVVLHAFIKKTQKTPPMEIDIARKRMREFES